MAGEVGIMKQPLVVVVLSCVACVAPTTTLTKTTATGGAFRIVGGSPESLRVSTRQALDGMEHRCSGPFEITAIQNVPQPDQTFYYLDTKGAAASGPYKTELEFECRQPQSVALNQTVQAFSESSDVMKQCSSDYECEGGRFICLEGYCRKTY